MSVCLSVCLSICLIPSPPHLLHRLCICACTDRDMISDERSEYHLQSACLVLAAHRVMTKQLKMDPGRSIEAIKQVLARSRDRAWNRRPASINGG